MTEREQLLEFLLPIVEEELDTLNQRNQNSRKMSHLLNTERINELLARKRNIHINLNQERQRRT